MAAVLCSVVATAWSDAGADGRIGGLNARIAAAPSEQFLFIQRGLAYSNDKQPGAAMRDIEQAEALGDPVDVALARGILHYRAAEFAAARSAFDLYLASYGQDHTALTYRYRLLRDMGDHTAALADYHKMLALGMKMSPGFHVAAAQMAVQVTGVDDAIALLDTQIAILGPVTPLQRAAIDLEKQRQGHEQVLRRLGELDARVRATPEWHLEVARELVALDRVVEAGQHLSVAQEQLETARKTAAREQVRREVTALRQQLTGGQSKASNTHSEARVALQ